MTWSETENVEAYVAAAGHLLLRDPALHTVALTVVENARAAPDGTWFDWWTETTGEVTGAVSRTPPYPLLLTAVPDHSVASLVAAGLPDGGRVNGPTALAVQVAAVAARAAGRSVVLVTAERLHRLGALHIPVVPGTLRPATELDLPLLVAWFDAFVEEAALQGPADTEAALRQRLAYQGLWLWEHDGRVVAMAGRTRAAAGVVRIGPVYTPPEFRCRGYGGAVTAGVSREVRESGVPEVVLFTDLTNPTSNALYARLGYRGVAERGVFDVR